MCVFPDSSPDLSPRLCFPFLYWPLRQSLFLACLLGGAVSPALAAAVAGDGGGVAQGALDASEVGLGFLDRTVGPGFVQAFSLIFVSELGDKTFFIAVSVLRWHV